MKALFVALAILVASTPPRTPVSEKPDLDGVFAAFAAKTSPGCSVGVFQNGAVTFAKGYGSASIEHDARLCVGTHDRDVSRVADRRAWRFARRVPRAHPAF